MLSKSLIFWAAAVLSAAELVTANIHEHNHKRHGLMHMRRHPMPEVKTEAVTVYVDQHGNTIDPNSQRTIVVTVTGAANVKTISSCACAKAAAPTSAAPAPAAPEPSSEAAPAPAPAPTSEAAPEPEAPAPTSAAPVEPTPSPEPALEPSSSSSAAPPAQTSSAPSSGSYVPGTYPSTGKAGIVYSPYNADHSCKTKEQVAADIEKIKDFSPVRLYGVDCEQVQNVIAAVKPYGNKVFAGIWSVDKAEAELETLIEAVGSEWDSIHTIAIGNEVVNFGRLDGAGFAKVINTSRARLQQSSPGYFGPVVGVDTFVAIMSNPSICEASDYVAANCHSFFDGNIVASGTGEFLNNMKAEMAKGCGDKQIVITEIGWPTQGSPNGAAVPGVAEQQAALKSVADTQGTDVVLFTAFDDPWKENTALTFGTEQHWGIQDKESLY